jgi:F-type H+-transporting ATPase subunit epsilon
MEPLKPSRIQLEVVTPVKEILSLKVDAVTLPGELGEMQALPMHQPLLTSLRPGRLVWFSRNESKAYQITGGFAQVLADRVVVLADECTPISEDKG